MHAKVTLDTWKKSLSELSDENLLNETKTIARSERERTAWLVAHLAEVYRRNLALQRGHSSIFTYARCELGLTDAMAVERVRAAQLALELPEVIEQIASNALTLAAAGELLKAFQENKSCAPAKPSSSIQPPLEFESSPDAPKVESKPITKAEKKILLQSVLGKTRQESQTMLREWKQERSGTKETPKPRPSSTRKHYSKEWTELEIYLGAEELAKFDRLRDLCSHRLGTRDPHAVMNWLLELGLEKADPLRQEARAEKRAKARAERESNARATSETKTRAKKEPEKKSATSSENAKELPVQNGSKLVPEAKTEAFAPQSHCSAT